MNKNLDQDIVFTGIGAVTASGSDFESHRVAIGTQAQARPVEGYSLKNFKPAKHLSDRRMMKVVSHTDGIGLVAIEAAKKSASYKNEDQDPWKVGLYVGAPPSSSYDNQDYMDSMIKARIDGAASVKEFGATCMSSRPTTLLVGLPNNVLCYGSLILGAQGPNSNYISNETSAHVALMQTVRQIQREKIKIGFAGGFSGHSEDVNRNMFIQLGIAQPDGEQMLSEPYGKNAKGAVVADGAAFVVLERRRDAIARGARPLARYLGGALGSDALGPLKTDANAEALVSTITRALKKSGVELDEIGLVLTSGLGVPCTDAVELEALKKLFPNGVSAGFSSKSFGNLREAGGILEIGLLEELYEGGEVPVSMRFDAEHQIDYKIEPEKSVSLIIRTSPWGEYSCLVVGRELRT